MAITKTISSRATGTNDDSVQVFVENTIVDIPVKTTSPFNFEVPVYSTAGASFNFYSQDTDAISTNLNNTKTLVFSFSANTESFSGVTQMVHDIYRLDIEPFDDVVSNFTASTRFEEAISAITNPITTVFEPVSASTFTTSTAHTFTLPLQVKPAGYYTMDLLKDKSQFFIDSKFVFPKAIDQTLGDVQTISGDSIATLYTVPTGDTEMLYSSGKPHQITGGTFSGSVVNGIFFTYFSPPHKPDINVFNDGPSVIGTLPTFTPIFSFKNVDDGDYYKLQVSYNTGDTTFSGDTTLFKIQKQSGDAELVRNYSVGLTPNSNFIYRVGNTKEIINIFNVKQNVTSWGEYAMATTANDGTFTLSGTVYKNIIGGNTIAGAYITITIQSVSSSVDLGSDSIEDSNVLSEVTEPLGGSVGSTTTFGPTATNGTYSFGAINGGTYTVSASHSSYPLQSPQVVTVVLTQNTTVDFVFGLTWGDIMTVFTDPETFL